MYRRKESRRCGRSRANAAGRFCRCAAKSLPGKKKMQYGRRRGSFSDSIRSSRGSAALFQKTCPEGRAFFFLLRKEMKEIFLYKNFIRPAGTY